MHIWSYTVYWVILALCFSCPICQDTFFLNEITASHYNSPRFKFSWAKIKRWWIFPCIPYSIQYIQKCTRPRTCMTLSVSCSSYNIIKYLWCSLEHVVASFWCPLLHCPAGQHTSTLYWTFYGDTAAVRTLHSVCTLVCRRPLWCFLLIIVIVRTPLGSEWWWWSRTLQKVQRNKN